MLVNAARNLVIAAHQRPRRQDDFKIADGILGERLAGRTTLGKCEQLRFAIIAVDGVEDIEGTGLPRVGADDGDVLVDSCGDTRAPMRSGRQTPR